MHIRKRHAPRKDSSAEKTIVFCVIAAVAAAILWYVFSSGLWQKNVSVPRTAPVPQTFHGPTGPPHVNGPTSPPPAN